MSIRNLALAAAILAAAAPSAAKTLCGQLGDPDGRFYVLYKVKTKVGTIAPVHGYFITPAGAGTPFSGHYSVVSDDELYLTTSDGSGTSGFGAATNLRNWSAPLSATAGNGNHYGTQVNEAVTSAIVSTSTSFEECKNVPKFGLAN
jgi:hypothetical protein